MAKKEGRAQRVAIILIGLLFLATTVGGIVVSIMQNDEQTAQEKQIQELLKQQQLQQKKSAKKAKNAYIPKGAVTKLEITDIKTGAGSEVKSGDTVTVDYQGTLTDGTIFDSSYDSGKPATLNLNNVIEGWKKGIPGMKVGGKRRLVIPASMAYGADGTQGIPPNSALVFIIELKSIGGQK
jgi:FKBP-type peptidyl-prolyl cis-trans isomerase